MAVANLVSIFNPEKIILGGGVFGPAIQFISAIRDEAVKWAQPISMGQVELVSSKLGSDAGLYGAGFLALQERLTSCNFFFYMYKRNLVFAAACLGMLLFGIGLITLGAVAPDLKAKFQLNEISSGTLFFYFTSWYFNGFIIIWSGLRPFRL